MPTSEVEHLRRELRDVRYITKAILMALVGPDKAHMWEIEARVQAGIRRSEGGTPLAEVGIRGETLDWLTGKHYEGQDIETVEELTRRFTRDQVATMEGVGRKTLERIDAAIAGRSLLVEAWMEEEEVA